ncbi:hypothetical protein BLNAU_6530 [Blattamonas nauphoetae]|uniref:Uncharacterized protein n=1 Tax=Blattamonas nauphoetae TaxID=2049346 RepID=A0ABQ9Y426_9EUKA|nr:hypothetical protein BLNAU_6530 [Blattamonas nauphoetae]
MWQLVIVNVIIKTRCSSQLAPHPVSTRSIHSALLQTDFDACLWYQIILVLSTIISSFSLTHPVEKTHARMLSILSETFGQQPTICADELTARVPGGWRDAVHTE